MSKFEDCVEVIYKCLNPCSAYGMCYGHRMRLSFYKTDHVGFEIRDLNRNGKLLQSGISHMMDENAFMAMMQCYERLQKKWKNE